MKPAVGAEQDRPALLGGQGQAGELARVGDPGAYLGPGVVVAEDVHAVPVDGLPSHKNLVTALLHKRLYRRIGEEPLLPNPEIPTKLPSILRLVAG